MIARARRVLGVAVLLLALCGCDVDKPPPYALPSLPKVFGMRVTDGELQFWTGTACPGVSQVSVLFGDAGGPELILRASTEWGVEVDRLALGGPYPAGMQIAKPLPQGFDWHTATKVSVAVNSDVVGGGAVAELGGLEKDSAAHPDAYFFGRFGWLTPSEVAAKDATDFLTLCTPDPRDAPAVPRAFGTRVTDGRLQVWTGSPCPATTRVVLTFQPGQADLVLDADGSVGPDFERITVGEPSPGLKVVHDVPADFDWRTAQSLLLRVDADRAGWPSTTQLGEVIAGSAQHPDDAYYFQGVGWLSPADVAAKVGKDFLGTCTPAK